MTLSVPVTISLAAHCIFEKGSTQHMTEGDIYALVGRFDLTATNEAHSEAVDIQKIVPHPNWSTKGIHYDADILILRLKRSVAFTEYIQPVCLPTAEQPIFEIRGTVVGYGKSESGALHENVPRKVEIPSYTNDHCFFSDYQFARFGSPRTFCAGELGKTPCQGNQNASQFFILILVGPNSKKKFKIRRLGQWLLRRKPIGVHSCWHCVIGHGTRVWQERLRLIHECRQVYRLDCQRNGKNWWLRWTGVRFRRTRRIG